MPTLNIDTVDAPEPVKAKLRELDQTIAFEKQSRKGANSWLFFGHHAIRDQRVAAKFYDWGGDPAFHAEPRALAAIQSENVITVFDAAYVDADYAFFVTPFFPQGDLDEELCRGVLGNIRALNLTRDILSGLSHLHARKLLHRDLKPENVLLSETDSAVIGDFGSVKRIPDGHTTIPGSGHSLAYCPPESVSTGQYGTQGDIYQVGLVMYQLLGGSLPYEPLAWLNHREKSKYHKIMDGIDRQIFANDCIKSRIVRGCVVNLESLPPWVCVQLRRTVSRAVAVDPARRYQSCAEFLARLGSIRAQIRDWQVQEGFAARRNGTEYRIVPIPRSSRFQVQKRAGHNWRQDNSFSPASLEALVNEIDDRMR